jgi:hypothetical protein
MFSGSGGANAYVASVKYRGADLNKPGSFGTWIGYRNADTGFDMLSMSDCDAPEAMKYNFDPSKANNLSNIKGFEYGVEYTVFPNAALLYNMAITKRKQIIQMPKTSWLPCSTIFRIAHSARFTFIGM